MENKFSLLPLAISVAQEKRWAEIGMRKSEPIKKEPAYPYPPIPLGRMMQPFDNEVMALLQERDRAWKDFLSENL